MSQSLGTLLARLGADTTQFDTALMGAKARMISVGKTMKKVGMQMSMVLTLPLAAIGVASFKMAKDFETSLSKVVGLVGVAKEQVDAWRDDILKMAPSVGKMANELGKALFFITSAGIRGAEAMEVLEMSAKAASAGLGETKDVADLVTSAMNAYGSDILNAAQATDVLVAAVREGKAEASDLASSMGMVLPLASEMGVRFDEVGAAVAAMTRTGTNASTASMQLRQILASLLKPTEQAKEALIGMGTSASGLRKMIKEKGLVATLQKLKKITTEYGEEAMSTVFPNIRALSGVLDLMGSNAKDNIAIFDRMVDSSGSLEKAFAAAAETTQFKWNAAMSRSQVALIKLGDIVKEAVMPIITRLSKAVEGLGDWFGGLTESSKKLVVGIGGIVMVLGPLLLILGFLMTSVIPGLITGFVALNAVIMANPIGAIAVSLGLVVGAIMLFTRKTKEAITYQTAYNDLIGKEQTNLDLLFNSLENAGKGTRERKIAIDKINTIYGKYLKNAITEKTTTEDIAKAYTLINEGMIENITLKSKQADITKIVNASLIKQKEITDKLVSKAEMEKDPNAAALAYGRVYDIVDALQKQQDKMGLATKMTLYVDEDDIMSYIPEIPMPVNITSKEFDIAVKLYKEQAVLQNKLNNNTLFYDQLLKRVSKSITEIPPLPSGKAKNLEYIKRIETETSSFSDVYEYLGIQMKTVSNIKSTSLIWLAENLERVKDVAKAVNDAIKAAIPNVLKFRTAFANFDPTQWDLSGLEITLMSQIDNLNSALKSGLESLTVTFAEGIGDLITGDTDIKGFGQNILSSIGSFLKQMGSALIVYGGLMEAFKTTISNPFVAIAVGIAAIAAGQALMNLASKGPDMGGVQGLATGGVVTSGGIFEVGERGRETVALPKGSAVTPNGMLGGTQELFARISGEDIYLTNKRYTDKLGKVT